MSGGGEITRDQMRRYLAVSAMILIWIITFTMLGGMLSDDLAARVEKTWPPFTVIVPVLVAQIMQYVQVGSTETKKKMESSNVAAG